MTLIPTNAQRDLKVPYNKRMQSDLASGQAADARRYAA